jgi:hypothetical protein
MSDVKMTDHQPSRPSWHCRWCSAAWPCESARYALLAAYTGATVSLSLNMTMFMCEAMADLPATECGNIYARFIGWVRHVR